MSDKTVHCIDGQHQAQLLSASARLYSAANAFENELKAARSSFWEKTNSTEQRNIDGIRQLDQAIADLQSIKKRGLSCLSQLTAEFRLMPVKNTTGEQKQAAAGRSSVSPEIMAWVVSAIIAGVVLLVLMSMAPQ